MQQRKRLNLAVAYAKTTSNFNNDVVSHYPAKEFLLHLQKMSQPDASAGDGKSFQLKFSAEVSEHFHISLIWAAHITGRETWTKLTYLVKK